MRIVLNGTPADTEFKSTSELLNGMCPGGIAVVNSFTADADIELSEGDSVFIMNKDHIPSEKEADLLMSARDPSRIRSKLRSASIGIAGLGGLGSNIAAMLVRSGIGRLVISDMDTVDATNLNRQNYFYDDLGRPKTDATEDLLKRISPCTEIEKHQCRLTPENIPDIYGNCDIVCEALDSAEEKAMFINTVLEKCPDTIIISGLGMAGHGHSNSITTKNG